MKGCLGGFPLGQGRSEFKFRLLCGEQGEDGARYAARAAVRPERRGRDVLGERPAGLARVLAEQCEGEGSRGMAKLEHVPEGSMAGGRGGGAARTASPSFSVNDFKSQVKVGEKYKENVVPESKESKDVRGR